MTKKEIEKYYDDIYNAEAAVKLSDTNAKINEYNTQKEQASASVNKANSKLYTDYTMAKNELPAIMARQGITGGASETANIKLTSDYMNNVSENERKKNEELSALNGKITNLKASGQSALAKLKSQSALDIYNAVTKVNKEEYQTALSEAKLKAKYGDFSGYKALGINTAAMENTYNVDKASSAEKNDTTSKASSSTTSNTTGKTTSKTDSIENKISSNKDYKKYYSLLFKYGPYMANAAVDANGKLDKYLK